MVPCPQSSHLKKDYPKALHSAAPFFLSSSTTCRNYSQVSKALFADDIAIWTTDKYPIIARRKLKIALCTICNYCNFWKLKVNEDKTVYTIFTRSTKAKNKSMKLMINGKELKKDPEFSMHNAYSILKTDVMSEN